MHRTTRKITNNNNLLVVFLHLLQTVLVNSVSTGHDCYIVYRLKQILVYNHSHVICLQQNADPKKRFKRGKQRIFISIHTSKQTGQS